MPDRAYEYKRATNPNSYLLQENSIPGHKFGYVKRRRIGDRTFSAFKPTCSCKYKFIVWTHSKDSALNIFNEHIKKWLEVHQQFEGLENV